MNRESIKQRFNIIGNHPKLNHAIDVAIQVAPTDVTVLVNGENGTGKDIFSKIIHQLSKRRHHPLISINCGAIPEGTIDSELFGHEKGSFTSAYESRKGYFEEANGGVIFLDEIAELPLPTQARLLRILENGEFLRVGSSKVQKTDVRVIAATNKNLVESIKQGKFREDLYFRLNTVTIYVPPLRERGEDIEAIFRFFANLFAQRYGRNPLQLTEAAKKYLYQYHWPGNVRELRNFTEKLTVLIKEDYVTEEHMLEHLPVAESQLPVLVTSAAPVSPTMVVNSSQHDSLNAKELLSQQDFILRTLYELKADVQFIKHALLGVLQNPLLPAPKDRYTPNTPLLNPATNYSNSISAETSVSSQAAIAPIHPDLSSDNNEKKRVENNPPSAVSHSLAEATDKTVVNSCESLSLESKERELIIKALEKHKQNRKRAAQELGISERTLYRKIKVLGLEQNG